jgi:hypothetical protein
MSLFLLPFSLGSDFPFYVLPKAVGYFWLLFPTLFTGRSPPPCGDLPMPASTLVLTITSSGMTVSARAADGTQSRSVPVDIVQDRRLGNFVDSMQALAQAQLASREATAIGRPADGDPTIAGETAHGELGPRR